MRCILAFVLLNAAGAAPCQNLKVTPKAVLWGGRAGAARGTSQDVARVLRVTGNRARQRAIEAVMRRLDWQLIRPQRGDDGPEPLHMAEIIRRLVEREASGNISDEDRTLLHHLEESYYADTVSTCEAVGAPVVKDDPHWESRVVDEFGETDVDMELEDYLDMRREEPDCENCPYTSPYSIFPMDPCEFSAGGLEVVLADSDAREAAGRPMDPNEMKAYAALLERALSEKLILANDAIDAEDYLAKAIYFLRFWADHGFAILPTDIDETIDYHHIDMLALDDEALDDDEDEDVEPDEEPSDVLH